MKFRLEVGSIELRIKYCLLNDNPHFINNDFYSDILPISEIMAIFAPIFTELLT